MSKVLVFERTVLTVPMFSVIILDLTPHVFLMQSFDLQRSSILIYTLILTFFTKCMIFVNKGARRRSKVRARMQP